MEEGEINDNRLEIISSSGVHTETVINNNTDAFYNVRRLSIISILLFFVYFV